MKRGPWMGGRFLAPIPRKNYQGRPTFSEHSGNIPGTFREHSGNIQWTLSEHSVNIEWTLSEHWVNIEWTFSEHSVNIQGTFRGHSGNIQATFREHSTQVQIELSGRPWAPIPTARSALKKVLRWSAEYIMPTWVPKTGVYRTKRRIPAVKLRVHHMLPREPHSTSIITISPSIGPRPGNIEWNTKP
jgi:hypothetical protein